MSSTSASSFTADLFGSKKQSTPSSSSGTFASILSPPTAAVGRNSSNSEVIGSRQKQFPGNQAWNPKQGTPALCTEGANATYNRPYKDRSSMFQEERIEPCHLSSSLYYGGQDIYSHPPSNYASGSYPICKKDGGEDDPNENNSNGASRGNWWQGSLYY